MERLAILGGTPLKQDDWPCWPQVDDQEKKQLIEALNGSWSYSGPKETLFREKWSEYLGVKHCVFVANGTVSLQIILEAMDIGVNDEVIVPAITWQATAASVLDVNATPVLVDVCEDSWCIDPDCVEAAITDRTRAIIVVHLYGAICDMERIWAIAKKHGLFVIEDAAHQHGAIYNGVHVGALGDAASFSLQNSKTLTCGEGGLITTTNPALAQKAEALRNCGRKPVEKEAYPLDTGNYVSDGNFIQSGNYRVTEFQAAIMLAQFEKFPDQLQQRNKNATYLKEFLSGIPGIEPQNAGAGATTLGYYNFAFNYRREEFNDLPVEEFRRALAAELNFPVVPSYDPLHMCSLYSPLTKKRHRLSEEYIKQIDPARYSLPVSERVFQELSVCLHHKLLLTCYDDMELVGEAIKKVQRLSGTIRTA